MRIIAVCNQKGGTGKTTTAVNLAACLAEKGRSVLLIDLDPQANASSSLGRRDGGKGMYAVLTGEIAIQEIIDSTATKGVSLAPGSPWLADIETALAGQPDAVFKLADMLSNSVQYDYVLIDTPPTLGLLATNALIAAAEVLVPCEASPLAVDGLAALMRTIEKARGPRLNPTLKIAGILLCRVDNRRLKDRSISEMLASSPYADKLYKIQIRENTRLGEAPSYGQPITIYDSESNGAADYRTLAGEVLSQEGV